MVNKRGPKMDPWGTPHVMLAGVDNTLSRETCWERFFKYDEIQLFALPQIP